MGREFVGLFDDWAESYDETVNGRDNEYHEVFEDYEAILSRVAEKTKGTVLEFGVGTGNLTKKLLKAGHDVYGVEPSRVMREKSRARFPEMELVDGDFLHFPKLAQPIDTIVSTYAFHHLTDGEKRKAIGGYSEWLGKGGKIVFADTVFDHEQAREELLRRVESQGYQNLLHDLETEYYTYRDVLGKIFTDHGFSVAFTQLNRYVWLIDAVKMK
ncbi:MAG TPA: class I SAM-dependent methyltransferase [Bacillales bacterium]|nr:class I SAM-dependent methyltransferase [Bacillales bacterium]